MPLFSISKTSLAAVDHTNFSSEKKLQTLIEKNLQTVFGCRFVASEFSTGHQHAGRIDTLALSEDNNPVIIEYKKIESSDLINQSLFYLAWIQDHRGDFEIAAQKTLGSAQVDWSGIRVICIAPNYKKYDLHAAQVMGANLELWTYRLFTNGSLYLEEVFRKSVAINSPGAASGKQLTAGQKAPLPPKPGVYTVEQHFTGKPAAIRELAKAVEEFMLSLDPSMEVVPKKFYIAFKISQNIVCMALHKEKVLLHVKLDPKKVTLPQRIARDVTKIGHYGTGDLELSVRTQEDLQKVKPVLEQAYQSVGG